MPVVGTLQEVGAAWCAREWDDVADVRHPGGVRHRPVKPEPEPGVRHRAVPAQIAIPPVDRRIESHLAHPRIQHIEALLALAASDDLAHAGREHIHRRHGAFVVVQAHVERLDLLRVVEDHHRAPGVHLAQIPLVLGLQGDAPLHGEFERTAGSLQDLDGLRVLHSREARVDQALEPGDRLLVDPIGEERHVVGALVEDRAEAVLEQVLGEVGVVRDVGERDLRLDHPELGEMPAGVRVLGPEGGPERVDVRERQAVRLDVELARHGEEGRPAEEVLGEIDRSLWCAGEVGQVERRDPEHLSGALGIAGGHDGRVHPVEAALMKVAMDGHGEAMPDPGNRAEGVGPHPQVRHLPEIFERVPLRRDRVALRVVHPANDDDGLGEQLDRLPLALRGCESAGGGDGAAGGQTQDLVLVVAKGGRGHHLQGIEAGPIMKMQEGKPGLRIATRTDPTLYRHARAGRRPAREDIRDSACLRHESSFWHWRVA